MADQKLKDALFEYLVRLGDDHLILGQRVSECTGHAPMLEEDLALSNVALDMIGQARVLYAYAGEVEGSGRDEDMLAFMRKEHEYHNLMLVEKANKDFAHVVVRQLFFSVQAELLWEALGVSTDKTLAAIAAKAAKEANYHIRHSGEWVIRLGDGTEESAARLMDALHTMAPYIEEMFDNDEVTDLLVEHGIAVEPSSLRASWREKVSEILNLARVDTAILDAVPVKGARSGKHTESMGHILSELQYMQRTYPGCQW